MLVHAVFSCPWHVQQPRLGFEAIIEVDGKMDKKIEKKIKKHQQMNHDDFFGQTKNMLSSQIKRFSFFSFFEFYGKDRSKKMLKTRECKIENNECK